VRLDPNNWRAFYYRSIEYRAKGNYENALADYSAVIRLDESNVSAYAGRGNSYFAKRDYEHAIADYGEAVRIDRGIIEASTIARLRIGRYRITTTQLRISPLRLYSIRTTPMP
jgi:tetratricopeptide (TPR) repeat protein